MIKLNISCPGIFSDISIVLASIPTPMNAIAAQGVLWSSSPGNFLLDVPLVARYLVTSGNCISIEPSLNSTITAIEHHLAMLPFAALLYQRGFLAFHAAAVSNDQGAILITGDSGSGKSTLLTSLLQLGWNMMADDLAVVGLDELGLPVVLPTENKITLWPETLNKMGIASDSLLYSDANRLELMPPESVVRKPQRIQGIYHLSVHSKKEVVIGELAMNARFKSVGTYLYNSHVADSLCNRVEYMRCVSAIVQSVPIRTIRRPQGEWTVSALVDGVTLQGTIL